MKNVMILNNTLVRVLNSFAGTNLVSVETLAVLCLW